MRKTRVFVLLMLVLTFMCMLRKAECGGCILPDLSGCICLVSKFNSTFSFWQYRLNGYVTPKLNYYERTHLLKIAL